MSKMKFSMWHHRNGTVRVMPMTNDQSYPCALARMIKMTQKRRKVKRYEHLASVR